MIESCIYDADADGPEFFCIKWLRANKPHRCCECKNAIIPGDRYERLSGVWDGQWDTFKTCKICATVRSDFVQSCEIGGLWESMIENHGLGYDTILDQIPGFGPDMSDQEWAALHAIKY